MIIWAGTNTCETLGRAKPLRLLQGLQYLKRQRLSDAFKDFCEKRSGQPLHSGRSERFLREMQEEESQGLQELYAPDQDRTAVFEKLIDRKSNDPIMRSLIKEYDEIRQSGIDHRNLDEEQEHEITYEIQQEQEYQFQHPLWVEALPHDVTPGLEDFIATGILSEKSRKFIQPAFGQFQSTSAAVGLDVFKPNFCKLLATRDFVKSVKLPPSSPQDMYLATADWILTSCRSLPKNQVPETVIISQFEANEFLPQITRSSKVRLDPYVPKTRPLPISFGDLKVYTHLGHQAKAFPNQTSLRELNLFMGALHLDTYGEFSQLCSYLGIITLEHPAQSRSDLNKFVSSDGFTKPKAREQLGWPGECPFERSPIHFLKKLLSMRHRGQDISSKVMGMLVDGKGVSPNEFLRKGRRGTKSATPSGKRGRCRSEDLSTDQDSEGLLVRKRPRLSPQVQDGARKKDRKDGFSETSRDVKEENHSDFDGEQDPIGENMDIDT